MNAEGTPQSPHIGPQQDATRRTPSGQGSATEQAAGAAHHAVDRAAESAGKAEERLRDAAAAGEQRLREKGEEARVVAERTMDHVREYTKENPLAAAGIAFAAGVILSRLMSR